MRNGIVDLLAGFRVNDARCAAWSA